MAIKGYLNKDTYCTITNTIYEKDLMRCTVSINIYESAAKQNLLANTGVTVEGGRQAPSLWSLVPQKTVPENLGDCYFLIAEDAEGALKGLEGRIARKNKITNEIESYFLVENSFLLYVEDEQKYRLYKNGSWEEYTNMTADKRIWDKWMAPEVALAEGTNPTKQMYKFMKTLPQFKDCEDI